MLKKLTVAMILAVMLLITAAPAFATPSVAPVPTAQDLLTQLNAGDQARINARTLALQAQGLQAAADTAKGVYDAAQKTASDALVAAQTADATARGSLPSFVTVVAQPTLSAIWAPIAQLLPGNALVQAAWNAAKTAESLQTVATQKATEWSTAQTAAADALQKATAAMTPAPDPAIAEAKAAQAKAEGETKEAKTNLVKAETRATSAEESVKTLQADKDRFAIRNSELEKKLAATPAPVTPAPAAPAAPAITPTPAEVQLRRELDAAQVALTTAKGETTTAVKRAETAEATAKTEKTRADQADALVAKLREELAAAKTATQSLAAIPTAPAVPATQPAPATTTAPAEPMATKASVDALEKRVAELGTRLTTVEETVKGTAGLKEAVEKLTSALTAQTAEIAGLRQQITTFQTTVAAQAATIITLRADLEAFQAQLFWTWIALAGLLGLGLLFAASIGVRHLWVARRVAQRTAAGASGTSGTAPVTGGAPRGAPTTP